MLTPNLSYQRTKAVQLCPAVRLALAMWLWQPLPMDAVGAQPHQTPRPQVLKSQLSQLSQLCQLCPGSPHWKVSLSILVGSTLPARKLSCSGFKFEKKDQPSPKMHKKMQVPTERCPLHSQQPKQPKQHPEQLSMPTTTVYLAGPSIFYIKTLHRSPTPNLHQAASHFQQLPSILISDTAF